MDSRKHLRSTQELTVSSLICFYQYIEIRMDTLQNSSDIGLNCRLPSMVMVLATAAACYRVCDFTCLSSVCICLEVNQRLGEYYLGCNASREGQGLKHD